MAKSFPPPRVRKAYKNYDFEPLLCRKEESTSFGEEVVFGHSRPASGRNSATTSQESQVDYAGQVDGSGC